MLFLSHYIVTSIYLPQVLSGCTEIYTGLVCKPVISLYMFEMYQNVNLQTTYFMFIMNVWVSYLIMTYFFFLETSFDSELLVIITRIHVFFVLFFCIKLKY